MFKEKTTYNNSWWYISFYFSLQAAYLLSKHKNIVMCIQDLKADSVDNGNTVRINYYNYIFTAV